MDKHRFSLLLLEPGEIYFEDFSVHFQISGAEGVTSEVDNCHEIGRLKVCSKSLVFDPQDHSRPIIKILFRDCQSISRYEHTQTLNAVHRPGYLTIVQGYIPDFPNEVDRSNNVLQVKCNQFVEIFEGNILAPYKFRNTSRTFLFSLNYASVKDCLELILKLHKASTLSMGKQIEEIAEIEMERQSLVKFDPLWLHPFNEKVILETIGNKITPLVMNGGRLILTNLTFYYQPFNKIEPYHILEISLRDIKSITKRRFLLQHVGLELNYNNSYLYLSLKSQKDRDHLYESIVSQPAVALESSEPEVMTLQWQNGVISNYDYLLYLNSRGDRTFNDLTQYPVFPWVISDYISPQLDLTSPTSYRDLRKPVGALNLERLQKLKERYEEMSPPKFLYGSHYSTPGFVLFYLVRKYPHYMLCLQNGKFDHPDRMFNSISDVWKNVQTNMSDFKELVPEFYDTEAGGDFLENLKGIQFGYRCDGTRVNDVTLPPWAQNRVDFVKKLREALESDLVSANLHHWIDLIFGYKQRDEEAVSANNVFFYLCYEGAVDLENITDRNERHSKEVQIMEYGQVPKQLFFYPHPEKRSYSIPRALSSSSGGHWPNLEDMKVTAKLPCHKDVILGIDLSEDSKFIASVGKDSTLKIHNSVSATRERNVPLSHLPLSAVLILPSSNTVIAACWDGTLIVYDVECGRVVDEVTAHGDAVSCLCWASTHSYLISGSWDCYVRIWRVKHPYSPIRPASDLIASLDHDDKVTALAVNQSNTLLATGTCDGEITLWSLNSCSFVKKLDAHRDVVNALQFSPDNTKLVSCSDDSWLKVFDARTELVVFSKSLDKKLKCLAWDGMTLLVGDAEGTLCLWDLHTTVSLVKEFPSHEGSVLAMCASADGRLIVTGGEDKTLRVWR